MKQKVLRTLCLFWGNSRSAWKTNSLYLKQACGCTATDSSLKGAWRGLLNGLVRDSVASGACAHRSSVFCARLQFCLCQPGREERHVPASDRPGSLDLNATRQSVERVIVE